MSKILIIIIAFLISNCCQGQDNLLKKADVDSICNQEVYGTKGYIKNLPRYICIPDGFVIDDYIRFSDKDKNGENDFIAIKYNKKEDDQIDGDTTFWDFYEYNIEDSIFDHKCTLTNIVPLYIQSISFAYLAKNPFAEELFNKYPRRISHSLSFIVKHDTLRLSYKMDDVYGKTFIFSYDEPEGNWFLKEIEYFIGELPSIWWQNNEFYYSLRNSLLVIEKIKPKKNISIDQFNLIEAFRYREIEIGHLSEWHIDRIDETTEKSILEVKLDNCNGILLPKDWIY
ncbi:hypothetical protein [Labilibaculum manganireducens]|uniref:hypothetical protein n=1 Tax=Labilibaculum manganireducens TaxID=1940525 RepID=UPI0029F55577|nr:hypothetical protein [Labilibaculum manganireducens]